MGLAGLAGTVGAAGVGVTGEPVGVWVGVDCFCVASEGVLTTEELDPGP